VKSALKAELLHLLTDALETAREAHAAAIEGAVHAEARAENAKDTRGLEQSYLARGQAERVAELEKEVADVGALRLEPSDVIAMGSRVFADEGGKHLVFFVAPAGGGNLLRGAVQVVTLASPLGRALLGRRVDDEVELQLPGRLRYLVITGID
jgi:transcription elongation GreA/GreB family factor